MCAGGCWSPFLYLLPHLGHRHITTTQIYDKRRRRITSESASHDVQI
jgi:hypothetical protein